MALVDDENGSDSCATTVMNGFRIPHTIVIVKHTTTKRRGPGASKGGQEKEDGFTTAVGHNELAQYSDEVDGEREDDIVEMETSFTGTMSSDEGT